MMRKLCLVAALTAAMTGFSAANAAAQLKDGTWTGEGQGRNGAIVVEAGNEKMEPTILPGEKLLCMPVSESSVNYVTGVVFVVFGDMALVRRIKTNEAGKDIVILTTDDESETVSVRKSDVIKIYRVVMSISRPIC